MARMAATSDHALVSDAHQRLVERSERLGPGPARTAGEAELRAAINDWPDLGDEARASAVSLARRVLGMVVRVEVGAGDAEFTTGEAAEIVAGLLQAQGRSDFLSGVLYRTRLSPMQALAKLFRDAVCDLPVPPGCTGYYDDVALLAHDGDTCPVHEETD